LWEDAVVQRDEKEVRERLSAAGDDLPEVADTPLGESRWPPVLAMLVSC